MSTPMGRLLIELAPKLLIDRVWLLSGMSASGWEANGDYPPDPDICHRAENLVVRS